jgi:hypothetical protein
MCDWMLTAVPGRGRFVMWRGSEGRSGCGPCRAWRRTSEAWRHLKLNWGNILEIKIIENKQTNKIIANKFRDNSVKILTFRLTSVIFVETCQLSFEDENPDLTDSRSDLWPRPDLVTQFGGCLGVALTDCQLPLHQERLQAVFGKSSCPVDPPVGLDPVCLVKTSLETDLDVSLRESRWPTRILRGAEGP